MAVYEESYDEWLGGLTLRYEGEDAEEVAQLVERTDRAMDEIEEAD